MKLKPEVGGDEIKVELNDQKNGTYLAEYTVDKLCGKLTLSVFLRGAHIKSSPFSVLVEPLKGNLSPGWDERDGRNAGKYGYWYGINSNAKIR